MGRVYIFSIYLIVCAASWDFFPILSSFFLPYICKLFLRYINQGHSGQLFLDITTTFDEFAINSFW